MYLPSMSRSFSVAVAAILSLSSSVAAINYIGSDSLNPCQDNSGFTATLFDVTFTPNNGSLAYNINGVSSISGNVIAELEVIVYGFTAYKQRLDPCADKSLSQLCPISAGQIVINSNSEFPASVVKEIPSIAYGVPDLDGTVRIYINSTSTNTSVACVEAQLSNGKTVDLAAIGWITAVIAGIGLVTSAIMSGLGHSNSAAHVAANALSLFSYFQSQAMIGMTAVHMPPIVQSWTQNFMWSMGIIKVGFVQNICTWYQRSTGGTPATLLSSLSTTSVQVQKRSVEVAERLILNAYHELNKRAGTQSASTGNTGATAAGQVTTVYGIKRAGFRAGIESTNIFLTGLIFFIVFVVVVAVGVALFKALCEAMAKAGWIKGDKFLDFRNGWKVVLKGILFRIVLIGYPQMCILCLWELIQRDSAAEVVLALLYFLSMTAALLWAAAKVIRLAKRSIDMHKNPAYILYSDPKTLNKWGFLYVQFRATAYYFILPVLGYILIKAAFIAFAQGASVVQAIALVIIEAGTLIAVCILRPWMDKKTNGFNISIAVINFINVIFLLVFTNVFNQPGIATGVMGVIFFIYNAAFALILLLMVLISSVWNLVSKNPETRYQPMRDDRGSFIKSQTNVNTELDALGATARGDMKYKTRDLDDDGDSFSSGSLGKERQYAAGVPLPPSTSASNRDYNGGNPPLSPINPSAPFLPSHHGGNQYGVPSHQGSYSDSPSGGGGGMYNGYNGSGNLRSTNNSSPAPRSDYQPFGQSRNGMSNNGRGYNQPGSNTAPWQRGAGYDH